MNLKPLHLALIGAFLLTGCSIREPAEPLTPLAPIDTPPPVSEEPFLLEGEARQVAESECIKGGETIGPGYYNEYSKTWWFDANLNNAKEGCSPACVVHLDGAWEINWRCTGLIEED